MKFDKLTHPIKYQFPYSKSTRLKVQQQTLKLYEWIDRFPKDHKYLNTVLDIMEKRNNGEYMTNKQLQVLHIFYVELWNAQYKKPTKFIFNKFLSYKDI